MDVQAAECLGHAGLQDTGHRLGFHGLGHRAHRTCQQEGGTQGRAAQEWRSEQPAKTSTGAQEGGCPAQQQQRIAGIGHPNTPGVVADGQRGDAGAHSRLVKPPSAVTHHDIHRNPFASGRAVCVAPFHVAYIVACRLCARVAGAFATEQPHAKGEVPHPALSCQVAIHGSSALDQLYRSAPAEAMRQQGTGEDEGQGRVEQQARQAHLSSAPPHPPQAGHRGQGPQRDGPWRGVPPSVRHLRAAAILHEACGDQQDRQQGQYYIGKGFLHDNWGMGSQEIIRRKPVPRDADDRTHGNPCFPIPLLMITVGGSAFPRSQRRQQSQRIPDRVPSP